MSDFIPGYTQCDSGKIIDLAEACVSVFRAELSAAIVVEADRLHLQINDAIDRWEQASWLRRKFMSKPDPAERMTREEVASALREARVPTGREVYNDDAGDLTIFEVRRYLIASRRQNDWHDRVRRLLMVAQNSAGPHYVDMDLMYFMVKTAG